jgi:hypothetical protein
MVRSLMNPALCPRLVPARVVLGLLGLIYPVGVGHESDVARAELSARADGSHEARALARVELETLSVDVRLLGRSWVRAAG